MFNAFIVGFQHVFDFYIFKVNNENAKTTCEICSKLKMKIPERRQSCRSGVFIVNFEQILHVVLLCPLLTLNR